MNRDLVCGFIKLGMRYFQRQTRALTDFYLSMYGQRFGLWLHKTGYEIFSKANESPR